MKALVVGLGSIGRRHVLNLKAVDPKIDIGILRLHSKDTELGDAAVHVRQVFVKGIDALQWRPDVVIVANPAPFHIKTAMGFAVIGSHLFIEKPLSVDLEGVDRLIKEGEKRRLVMMVGYVLRFFEPLKLIKGIAEQGRIGRILSVSARVGRYLPDWRPGTDYRKNVSARKEMGGGVIFELSHELDYLRWLCGEVKEVHAVTSRVSNFSINVEDLAEITLVFKNKSVGHVHLDMLDRAMNRSCRVVGSNGTLVWDSSHGQYAGLFSPQENQWLDVMHTQTWDYNQMFVDEIRHFLNCVKKRTRPLVDLHDGLCALQIILAAKKSAKTGRAVRL